MNSSKSNPHLKQPFFFIGPAPVQMGKAVILIHGRSQGIRDMVAISEHLELPDMPFVGIQANNNSWYPDKFMAPIENNQPYLDWALQAVNKAVEDLQADGIPTEKIYLLGFSQGACLACEYIYRNPKRWGGLIAFTGGLIGPQDTKWERREALAGVPVLLGNSDEDEWVPLSRSTETAEVFQKSLAKVDFEVYPGLDHSVNDDEISRARRLLEH